MPKNLLSHNTEQLAARSQYSVTRTFVKRYLAALLRGSSLFILTLMVILITAYLTLTIDSAVFKSVSKVEVDTAVNQAKHLYRQEKEKGRDFSNGPCLSEALLPNWVMDIAHSPRLPIDDRRENQCTGYVAGRAQHFVELDPEGNLIRAK